MDSVDMQYVMMQKLTCLYNNVSFIFECFHDEQQPQWCENGSRKYQTKMPSSEVFAVAKEVTQILKHFHITTEIVGGEKYPTICIVHSLIHQWRSRRLREIAAWSSILVN